TRGTCTRSGPRPRWWSPRARGIRRSRPKTSTRWCAPRTVSPERDAPRSAGRRSVRLVVDHPKPGPELQVELVALGVLLHQPRGRGGARDCMHGDVLVRHAAAFANAAQVAGAGEGDALVAHARRRGADQ